MNKIEYLKQELKEKNLELFIAIARQEKELKEIKEQQLGFNLYLEKAQEIKELKNYICSKNNINNYNMLLKTFNLLDISKYFIELKEQDLITLNLKFLFYKGNSIINYSIVTRFKVTFLVVQIVQQDTLYNIACFKTQDGKKRIINHVLKQQEKEKKELKHKIKQIEKEQEIFNINSYKELYLKQQEIKEIKNPIKRHKKEQAIINYWIIRKNNTNNKEKELLQDIKRNKRHITYIKEIKELLQQYYTNKDIISLIVNYHNIEQIEQELEIELNYIDNTIIDIKQDLILEQEIEQELEQTLEQEKDLKEIYTFNKNFFYYLEKDLKTIKRTINQLKQELEQELEQEKDLKEFYYYLLDNKELIIEQQEKEQQEKEQELDYY